MYGAVVAGAESGDVIDLLPDREAATLEAWLKAHPGAEVICRDRADAYADGAAAGAPGAIQVADRWHLRHNLGEYVEKAVVAHRGCLTGAADEPAAAGQDAPPGQPPLAAAPLAEPDGLRDVCGREWALVSRTRERHAAVHELLKAGHSAREAARILGLSRNTVNRFARETGAARLLVKATSRESKLDPFKPWINRRWNGGIASAAAPARRTGRHPGLDLQRAGRRTLGPPVPHRRRADQGRPDLPSSPGSTSRPEDPPDHRLAADPPRPPRPRRPSQARRHQGQLPRTWTPWPGTPAASPR